MYTVNRTNAFKKSFKRALKRGLNPAAFQKVIDILQTEGSLPRQYKPQRLSSKFDYAWECHIENDWLLLWQQDNNEMTLLLLQTGTHSDIFG